MSLLRRFIGWIKALLLVSAFIFGLMLLWALLAGFSALLFLPDRYVVVAPTVLTAPFGIVGTYWLLRRLTARRERTIIAVTVALWLVIVLPVLAMPEEEFQTGPQPDPDADFSGVVSSEYEDENVVDSHEIELSKNERIRMEFDIESGQILWSIRAPNGNSTRGPVKGETPEGVRQTEDNAIIYTASEDGTYDIGISAEPYARAAYSIYIEDAE